MHHSLGCSVSLSAMLWFVVAVAADEPQAGDKQADPSVVAAAIFDKLDRNADGQVTADEVPDDRQAMFRRLLRTADRDKDGQLSRSEFAAGLESKRPARSLTEKLPDGNPGGPLYQDPEKTFALLDTNGDGKIVAEEVPDQARGMFERMLARADKDGDGAITKPELTAAVNELKPAAAGKPGQVEPAKIFEYLDKNADGKLSADEIPEGRPMIAQAFKRGDKDGDGALSREEFMTTIALLRSLQQGQPKPGTSPEGPRGPQRRTQADQQGAVRRFTRMDADHDGKVSQQEFDALQKKRFEKIDINGDGYLELSEIRQHAAAAGQNAAGRKVNPNNAERKPPADAAGAKAESDSASPDAN